MANKKKNPEVAPTPEQQARVASSPRQTAPRPISTDRQIVLVVINVLAMLQLRLGRWRARPDVTD